jgi:hypothetical protein
MTVDIHACSGHFGCPFSPHAVAGPALGDVLPEPEPMAVVVVLVVDVVLGVVSVGAALAVAELVALAVADGALLADADGSALAAAALVDSEADGSGALSLAAPSAVASPLFSPL